MKKFLYGVSTSAPQIEGDIPNDGRGISVWDTFCEKGKIKDGASTKKACMHYVNYREDIKLMKKLGINSYRFSIAWTRVLPYGIGEVNTKGLEFYSNLVDELLKNGIEPLITLYHWDLPQYLDDMGGFLNNDFPKWFEEYTKLIVDTLGNRCTKFLTFNEPINAVNSSYGAGVFAPGKKLKAEEVMNCILNMHLAHGLACKYIHSHIMNAEVSMAMSTFEEYPLLDTKECYDVARKHFFEHNPVGESIDVLFDPICLGKYPERCYLLFPEVMKRIGKKEIDIISFGTNFVGINNYSGYAIDENGNMIVQPAEFFSNAGKPFNVKGIEYSIRFVKERYGLPIYITENGMGCDDVLEKNGSIHDTNRGKLIIGTIHKIKEMIREGFDIRGYFVWSFMDNFEWLEGYKSRYGIVYVDYENNFKRYPKDSFYVYQDFLRGKNK